MSKQIATVSGVRGMGFQLKGTAPAFSNKGITKGELNQWYYVDNVAAGISSYPNNRVLTYPDLVNAGFVTPAAQFYQYDVTRSSIPNATGGFFTYTSTDFTTQTILQNTPGYVGRFCMQEGSFNNNQYNLYSISQVGVCYPNYGAYPQPYLIGCDLYFNNLGAYTIEDVKIYQLTDVANSESAAAIILGSVSGLSQATAVALGLVPGVNLVWGAVNLLTIAGGVLYGQTSKLTNVLRYIGTGAYTNGSVSLSTVGSSTGTPQYYIAYKVKNPQGFYPIVFGYGQYESSPPGLSSSCGGSGNTAAVWTDNGTTACVSCVATTVFKDTNPYSATLGKYKVGTNGAVVTSDPTSACDTASNYSTVHGYTYSCSNGTVSSTTVYKNSNPCFTGNQYKIGTTTYVDDPSQTAPSTSPNWVYQYQNCFNCVTRDVKRDMNECSSTYLGYTVDDGAHVGTTAPTNTGACNTDQVWTDTGVTRCNDCVNEKEQEQTNSCATDHTTKRWVAGGSACSTTQNWVVAFGLYECVGCDKYYVEIQNNPCAAGAGTTRRSSTIAESNSTYCGGCCGLSTAADWTLIFGDYECYGCDLYYKEYDANNCSATAGQVRRSNTVAVYNSSQCCAPSPSCITVSSQLISYDACNGRFDTVELVTITLKDQNGNAIVAPTDLTFTYSKDWSSNDDYGGYNSGTSTGNTMTIYAGNSTGETTLYQYTNQYCVLSQSCDGTCYGTETNFTITGGPYPQCP